MFDRGAWETALTIYGALFALAVVGGWELLKFLVGLVF